MQTNSFENFKITNPNYETEIGIYQLDSEKYKRVVIQWKETEIINHVYHACISTETGDLYFDCSREKLLAKHFSLVFATPLYTYTKTWWHFFTLGPLIFRIIQWTSGNLSDTELATFLEHSFIDIVRTPLYGIALTITHIAAGILYFFDPNLLYKTREVATYLERSMLRVENIEDAGAWALSPCLGPFINIGQFQNSEEVKEKLDNFLQKHISFRRKYRILFNDSLTLLGLNEAYISPIARE